LSLLFELQCYQDELRNFRDQNQVEESWSEDGRIKKRTLNTRELVAIEKEILRLHQIIRTLTMYYGGAKEIERYKGRLLAKS